MSPAETDAAAVDVEATTPTGLLVADAVAATATGLDVAAFAATTTVDTNVGQVVEAILPGQTPTKMKRQAVAPSAHLVVASLVAVETRPPAANVAGRVATPVDLEALEVPTPHAPRLRLLAKAALATTVVETTAMVRVAVAQVVAVDVGHFKLVRRSRRPLLGEAVTAVRNCLSQQKQSAF